jgi:uncharacterized protein YhhL (DUF1145 family)
MEKMLKKFGYTNIALLVFSVLILTLYVDFKNISAWDYVLIILFGLLILIHIIRIIILLISAKGR